MSERRDTARAIQARAVKFSIAAAAIRAEIAGIDDPVQLADAHDDVLQLEARAWGLEDAVAIVLGMPDREYGETL